MNNHRRDDFHENDYNKDYYEDEYYWDESSATFKRVPHNNAYEDKGRGRKKSTGFIGRAFGSLIMGLIFSLSAAVGFRLIYDHTKLLDGIVIRQDSSYTDAGASKGSGGIAEKPERPGFNSGSLPEEFSGIPQNPGSLSGDNADFSDAFPQNGESDAAGISDGADVGYNDGTQGYVMDVSNVVEVVMPAVVSISNHYTSTSTYWGQRYTEEVSSSGSGIIVGLNETELLITTNYHVVEKAETLYVTFADESTSEASIKGTDSGMDLAVIAVRLDTLSSGTISSIAVATLGDSETLSVGEPAIAIGNALGYGQSVTLGVISALHRQVDTYDGTGIGEDTEFFIQTDAAINPGNSGGALLNIKGEVIGINSNKIGGSSIEGMGYAIPISAAIPIIEKLISRDTRAVVADSERGFLGITGETVSQDASKYYGIPVGVYVSTVHDGTAAERSGLKDGDVIYSFDGQKVTGMNDLQDILKYYRAGETVEISIKRITASGYQDMKVLVTLGKRK